MKMKNIYKKIGILLLFLASACDLDGDLVDPNQISVDGADVNLIMNTVQLEFADFMYNAHQTVAPLVRHEEQVTGYRYPTAFQPQLQNNIWTNGYQEVLINAQTMIELAETKGLTTHVAAGKIMQAYTYITLVDLFGDIPQAEALDPAIFNPVATGGEDVYRAAIALIGEARTELAKTGTDVGGALSRDIYYGGSRTLWTALANSLELKAWLNMSTSPGLAAEANGKIATFVDASGAALVDLVDTDGENFTYKYTATTVPQSRHPYYNQYYDANAGAAGGYIGTDFMYEMVYGKPDPGLSGDPSLAVQDPRWRYYFKRQVGSIAAMFEVDPKALGCTQGTDPNHYIAGNFPFCVLEGGFYGRDHLDGSGTPPDGPVMTMAGVYPAGGEIDNTSLVNDAYKKQGQRGQGANGAGIMPIFMGFYTDYMVAEHMARQSNAGAKAQLMTAITNSITSVKAFGTAKKQTPTASLVTPTADYLTAVGLQYDAAVSPLHAVGRETWLATYGNAVEAYNSYRRTGGYDKMQPPLQLGAGPWMRRLVYPSDYVNLNSSASQIDAEAVNKVFWDGNPETLN
jgi:hypothetical protein